MARTFRAMLFTIATVLVLATALFFVSRMRGPSIEEAIAIDLLAPQPSPTGRNAASALWLLKYDVPEDRQDDILGRDMLQIAKRIADGRLSQEIGSTYESIAATEFALLEDNNPSLPYCGLREEDCVGTVKADIDGYAGQLARDARLIARIRALGGYDYHRVPAGHPEAQIHIVGGIGPALVLRTQHALDIASGDTERGLAGACGEIATWRRLGGDTDSLIVAMSGTAIIDGAIDLIAKALDELPPGTALPERCVAALKPMSPQELSLCNPMRGELVFTRTLVPYTRQTQQQAGWSGKALLWLIYDADKSYALHARTLAPACGPKVADMLERDLPVELSKQDHSPWRLECLGNIAGCKIAEIAPLAYDKYFHRRQDTAAKLRMAAMLAWLHANPPSGPTGHPLEQRLLDLQEDLADPTRPVTVSADGHLLVARAYADYNQPSLTLPLPASLVAHNTGSHSAK